MNSLEKYQENEEEYDRRMNAIGQNGNDGLHYEEEGRPPQIKSTAFQYKLSQFHKEYYEERGVDIISKETKRVVCSLIQKMTTQQLNDLFNIEVFDPFKKDSDLELLTCSSHKRKILKVLRADREILIKGYIEI